MFWRRRDSHDVGSLFPADSRPAFLFGAGISLDSPANLIDGRRFMEAVLQRMLPECVASDRERLLRCIREPEPGYRPGEYIRFELLMKALRDSRIDRDLHVLDCLEEAGGPNANHFAAALLIRAGCCVITTNFDSLIERAWATLFDTPLPVAIFDHEFPAEGAPDLPALWKIHGSLRRDGVDTRQSIAATVTSVLAHTVRGGRIEFFRNVLRSRDLVLAGYSGSDDFDLVPILATTDSERRIVWIEHEQTDAPLIIPRGVIEQQWRDVFPLDLCGKPMLFSQMVHPRSKKERDRLTVVRGRTARVIGGLVAHLTNSDVPSADARGPRFDVESWFDAWAERCAATEVLRCDFVQACFETWLPARAPDIGRKVALVIANTPDVELPPRDRLNRLIERFNRGQFAFRDRSEAQDAELRAIAVSAAELEPLLDDEGIASLRRLQACIAYKTAGAEEGERLFEAAADDARAKGLLDAEISTLETWLGFFYDGLSEGNFGSGNVEPGLQRRIADLENRTGFFALRWKRLAFQDPALETSLDEALYEAEQMRHHAIQTGSVFGEALVTLRLGLLLWQRNEIDRAESEFVRLHELERALGRPVQMPWAIFDPRDMNDLDGTEALRRAVRRSMWRGAEPVPIVS